MFNFVQVQGQFRRKAELDRRQAARKGDPAELREGQREDHVCFGRIGIFRVKNWYFPI
jgi:hypothetical protein